MSIKLDKYTPLMMYLSPASIPQIVAHIQDYLVKHPILSVETIAEIIVQSLQEHPELINGEAIPISADSQQSIKAYIDALPFLDTYTKAEINALLLGKQDTLTFDQAPTPGSSNPVTSSGIIAAMSALQSALETQISNKADRASTYTKTQVDTLLEDKADADDVYSKNTMDAKLLDVNTDIGNLETAVTNQSQQIEYYRMPSGILKTLKDIDLNTVVQSGIYYSIRSTNGPANVSEHGYLKVMAYNNDPSYLYIRQEYMPHNSPYVYVRNINESTWTKWTSVNAHVDNIQDGLAVVANGDTHAAITKGQYVYIKNHASLTEGLYTANDNINTNGALSGKVTAQSGVLNVLKSNIDTLDNNLSTLMLMNNQLVSDCDTATDPNGNYYCDRSTLNKPTDAWFLLRTINRSELMVFQIASTMNTQNPDIYVRSSDKTGVFGSWKKVTLT